MKIRNNRLVRELASEDADLRDLLKRHEQYDALIEKLNKRRYLSPAEDREKKELQKRKLAEKDRIESLVRELAEKKKGVA